MLNTVQYHDNIVFIPYISHMGLLDFNTFNFENIKLKTQLGTFHLDQSANSPGTARIH